MYKVKLIVVCLGIIFLSGCVPVLVDKQEGFNSAYVAGELQAIQDASIHDSWQATQIALNDLGFNLVTQEKDGLSAIAKAEGANDKKVSIYLERKAREATLLKIRVGWMGDKDLSLSILDKIEEALPRRARA